MAQIDAHPDMERDLRFFPVQNTAPRKLASAQIEAFNMWRILSGPTSFAP